MVESVRVGMAPSVNEAVDSDKLCWLLKLRIVSKSKRDLSGALIVASVLVNDTEGINNSDELG